MQVEKSAMSILGEKYAVPIIIELFDKGGKMKISDFLTLITNYRTLENICKKLEDSGIILKSVSESDRYDTKYLQLTELGFKIAPRLKEIIHIIKIEQEKSNINSRPVD